MTDDVEVEVKEGKTIDEGYPEELATEERASGVIKATDVAVTRDGVMLVFTVNNGAVGVVKVVSSLEVGMLKSLLDGMKVTVWFESPEG